MTIHCEEATTFSEAQFDHFSFINTVRLFVDNTKASRVRRSVHASGAG